MQTKSSRERDPGAKLARISEAAFDLFQRQGFRETTIDQIAEAASVGRRTFFHHFASKEAVLFDHLRARRETAIERLRVRPDDEPPLASLYAVFREQAEIGYEPRLLAPIRSVIAAQPELATQQFWSGSRAFETSLAGLLEDRDKTGLSSLEIRALTQMVVAWFTTAGQTYITEDRASLLECFDEVVAVCARATAEEFDSSSDA